MAARRPLRGIMLQRLERPLRLKVSMILGYDRLRPLEDDWILTFMNERTLVLPLFGCKCCGFSYLLQMRLEGELCYGRYEVPSLEPLNQHQQLCKAFKLPIVRNAAVDPRVFSQQKKVGIFYRNRMDSVTRRNGSYEFEMVKETAPLQDGIQADGSEAADIPDIAPSASGSETDVTSEASFTDSDLPVNFDSMHTEVSASIHNEEEAAADGRYYHMLSEGQQMLLIVEEEAAVAQELQAAATDSYADTIHPAFVQQNEEMDGVQPTTIAMMDDAYVAMPAAEAMVPHDDYLQIEQVESMDGMVVRPKTVITRQAAKEKNYANLLASLPEAASKMNALLQALGEDSDTSESADNPEAWQDTDAAANGSGRQCDKEILDENIRSSSEEEEPIIDERTAAVLRKMFCTIGLVPVQQSTANQRGLSGRGRSDAGKMGRACEVIMKVVQGNCDIAEIADEKDKMDEARKKED